MHGRRGFNHARILFSGLIIAAITSPVRDDKAAVLSRRLFRQGRTPLHDGTGHSGHTSGHVGASPVHLPGRLASTLPGRHGNLQDGRLVWPPPRRRASAAWRTPDAHTHADAVAASTRFACRRSLRLRDSRRGSGPGVRCTPRHDSREEEAGAGADAALGRTSGPRYVVPR